MKKSTVTATPFGLTAALLVAGLSFAQDEPSVKQPLQSGAPGLVVTSEGAALPEVTAKLAPDRTTVSAGGPQDLLSPLEQRLEKVLREPTTLEFHEAPLTEVVDYIAAKDDIRVLIDRKALEDVGVAMDTPVTFHLEGVPLDSSLNALLRPLDLTWMIHDQVLWITTPEEAENQLLVRLYEVSDLIMCRDKTGERWADYDALIELITSTVAPDSWDEVGGAGSIEAAPFGGAEMLAIGQTYQIHRRIEQLLKQCRAIIAQKGTQELPVREKIIGGMIGFGGGGMGGMGGMRGGVGLTAPGTAGGMTMFGSGGGTGPVPLVPRPETATTPSEARTLIRVYTVEHATAQAARDAVQSIIPEEHVAYVEPDKLVVVATAGQHERVSVALQQLAARAANNR